MITKTQIEEMIKTKNDQLIRYCYNYCHNYHIAEELAQATWMRVILKAHLCKERDKYWNWILKVAQNLCRTHCRKMKLQNIDDDTMIHIDKIIAQHYQK